MGGLGLLGAALGVAGLLGPSASDAIFVLVGVAAGLAEDVALVLTGTARVPMLL